MTRPDDFGGEIKSLIDRAFEEIARQAVRDVIAREAGSAIDSDVKDAIKLMASNMVKEDVEIRKMIKDRIVYWIGKQ
jgi:hypothetical protein